MHALCVTYIYSAGKQSRLSVGQAAQRRGLFIYAANVMQTFGVACGLLLDKNVMHYNMRARLYDNTLRLLCEVGLYS
jgi:hypothetical protein